MQNWEKTYTQTRYINETIYEVKIHRTFSFSVCIGDSNYEPILNLWKSLR